MAASVTYGPIRTAEPEMPPSSPPTSGAGYDELTYAFLPPKPLPQPYVPGNAAAAIARLKAVKHGPPDHSTVPLATPVHDTPASLDSSAANKAWHQRVATDAQLQLPRKATWISERLVLARSRRDVLYLLYAFVYLLTCAFLVCLANAYADRVNTNAFKALDQKYVAPDLIMQASFHVFQATTWIPRNISDVFVQGAFVLMLGRAMLLGRWSVTVIRRCFYIVGTLYLLRAPMVSMTVLPAPLVTCETKYDPSYFYDALQLLSQQKVSCGDVFFSGHSIIFTSLIMLFWMYNRPTSLFFRSTGRAFLIPAVPDSQRLAMPPALAGSSSSGLHGRDLLDSRAALWVGTGRLALKCKMSAPDIVLSPDPSDHFAPMPQGNVGRPTPLRNLLCPPVDSRIAPGCSDARAMAESARLYSCVEHPPPLCNNVQVNLVINILATVYGILGMYSLIFSSYHYTIDVASGFLFTLLAWTMYHWIIRIRALREDTWLGRFVWRIDDPDFRPVRRVNFAQVSTDLLPTMSYRFQPTGSRAALHYEPVLLQ